MPSTANAWPHSPGDVVRYLLITLGAATHPDDGGEWPCFVSTEPDAPEECVTAQATQGRAEGVSMVDSEVMRKPGFQVRIRAADHPSGYRKAAEVRAALAGAVRVRVDCTDPAGEGTGTGTAAGENEYLVHCVVDVGDVLDLGRNAPKTRRHIFTVNALLAATYLGGE